MYEYLIVLKGENKLFATYEFETLWRVYFNEALELKQLQNTLYYFSSNNLISKDHVLLSRLTFVNFLSLILNKDCDMDSLLNSIDNKLISFLEGLSFSIVSKFYIDEKYENKTLAKPIWDNLNNPKVNLDNPEEIINFYGIYNIDNKENEFYVSREIFKNDKKYLNRMPKLRPIKRPYTLKSDMARASINILGLKENDILLDPFCGIGGILLEGYDMGLNILGNDISEIDLKLLRKNFDFYFPDAKYSLTQFDCSKEFGRENSVDGIVTDIPYGRACRKLGDNLYEEFFKNAKRLLKPNSRMVIIYANFNSAKKLALKYFNEEVEITEYINKSMTRYILVLRNDKN